jgi:hypothetical protein
MTTPQERMIFDALVGTIDWMSYYAEKNMLRHREDLIAQASNLITELVAIDEDRNTTK